MNIATEKPKKRFELNLTKIKQNILRAQQEQQGPQPVLHHPQSSSSTSSSYQIVAVKKDSKEQHSVNSIVHTYDDAHSVEVVAEVKRDDNHLTTKQLTASPSLKPPVSNGFVRRNLSLPKSGTIGGNAKVIDTSTKQSIVPETKRKVEVPTEHSAVLSQPAALNGSPDLLKRTEEQEHVVTLTERKTKKQKTDDGQLRKATAITEVSNATSTPIGPSTAREFPNTRLNSSDSDFETDRKGRKPDKKRQAKKSSKKSTVKPKPPKPKVPLPTLSCKSDTMLQKKTKQLDLSFYFTGVQAVSKPIVDVPYSEVVTKIPKVLAYRWAKFISPYSPPSSFVLGSTYVEACCSSLDFDSLGTFDGILLDPPWNLSDTPDPHTITPEEIVRVMDKGLLFVWSPKELYLRVMRAMAKWRFEYVENLVWVQHTTNNHVLLEDSPYFRRSKLTLLLFKRCPQSGKGNNLPELRHQRTPDVVFDFVKNPKEKPAAVYTMIETLLPTGCYDPATGRGRFIELWAQPGHRRTGWTSVVFVGETKPLSKSTEAISLLDNDEMEPLPLSQFDEEQEQFESQRDDTIDSEEDIPDGVVATSKQTFTPIQEDGYSSDEFEDPDCITMPLSPVY